MDGNFYKHAVAVALVVTDALATPSQQAEAVIDVRSYLEGLEQKELVDLLMERAAEDDIFDARLRMDAARATSGLVPVAVFQNAIDEAFVVGDYIGYREMYDYASNINSVLDSLQDLLGDGHVEAVITLAEHAVDPGRAADEGGRPRGGLPAVHGEAAYGAQTQTQPHEAVRPARLVIPSRMLALLASGGTNHGRSQHPQLG